MEEKDIGNGNGREALCSSCGKTHDDSGNEKVGVLLGHTAPNGSDEVQGKGHDVYRAATILVGERHPDEITETLEQGGAVEEVSRLGNGASHSGLLPVGEEVLGCL